MGRIKTLLYADEQTLRTLNGVCALIGYHDYTADDLYRRPDANRPIGDPNNECNRVVANYLRALADLIDGADWDK